MIKLHKGTARVGPHVVSQGDRRSGALAFHSAAFWLMLAVRDAIPQADPLAKAEFATIRERLIKIGARVIEHAARIRIQLPTSCPEGALFRIVALGIMPSAP